MLCEAGRWGSVVHLHVVHASHVQVVPVKSLVLQQNDSYSEHLSRHAILSLEERMGVGGNQR